MHGPTVHKNGTSKGSLLRSYTDAMNALDVALEKLALTAPNGRDYYPQGDWALKQAIAEHEARYIKLSNVREEVLALAIAVSDQ